MVAWFAGLFYIGRLFVYHKEALDQESEAGDAVANQLEIMEAKLFKIIMKPGMVGTIVFGTWYGLYIGAFSQGWLHTKLLSVFILIGYQVYCKRIMERLKTKSFTWSSLQLRAFNEVPAILLIFIVSLVYLRVTQPALMATAISIFLIAIGLYFSHRKRTSNN